MANVHMKAPGKHERGCRSIQEARRPGATRYDELEMMTTANRWTQGTRQDCRCIYSESSDRLRGRFSATGRNSEAEAVRPQRREDLEGSVSDYVQEILRWDEGQDRTDEITRSGLRSESQDGQKGQSHVSERGPTRADVYPDNSVGIDGVTEIP